MPASRERREDIPRLAHEFARKYSERFGLDSVVQLAPEFVEQLQAADWPGNVRQLENAIARSVALATGSVISSSFRRVLWRPPRVAGILSGYGQTTIEHHDLQHSSRSRR